MLISSCSGNRRCMVTRTTKNFNDKHKESTRICSFALDFIQISITSSKVWSFFASDNVAKFLAYPCTQETRVRSKSRGRENDGMFHKGKSEKNSS